MKFKLLLSLCALAVLAGCASTAPPTSRAPVAESDPVSLILSRELARDPQRSGKPGTAPSATPPAASSARAQGQRQDAGSEPLTAAVEQLTSSRPVAAMAAPADLWERIRRGYAMPDLQHDLVRDREQWYSSRPDYIFRMTERSRKYLFHIVEELELRNMPTELALLPFVESAFNPQAVSSAKAAGMWQFMPATGKSFELKQNVFRDDRRDVLASTRAALDYLQKLHGMFGDWHLALAAYNWGEGSVGRAIAKNKKLGAGLGYTDLNMPMETRMYVPKLQAIKNIVSNPAAFDSKLPKIENHPYFQTVEIRRDIDVTLAAKLAGVPLEDFKALNPSVNKPVILAAGTPQILLPWDNAEIFEANLQSFGAGRLASWTVWVAPTAMRAADAAKRVGMNEAEFRKLNSIPTGMLIRPGSALLVPRSHSTGQDVAESLADNGQVSFAPEVVLRKRTVKAGKNDNVASIARKFKVTPAQVAQWNKVGPKASFKAGQVVVVYTPAMAGTQTAKKSTAKGQGKTSVAKTRGAKPSVAKGSASKAVPKVAQAPVKKGVKVANR